MDKIRIFLGNALITLADLVEAIANRIFPRPEIPTPPYIWDFESCGDNCACGKKVE